MFSWFILLLREVARRGPPPLSVLQLTQEQHGLASIFHKLIWVGVEVEEEKSG